MENPKYGALTLSITGAISPEVSYKTAKNLANVARTGVRPCCQDDIPQVVEIHKARFSASGTLLAHLSRTLIAALYSEFLDRSVFLVHVSDGEVDGFVVGGWTHDTMRCKLAFLRRHTLFCIANIARCPRFWYRAVRFCAKVAGKCFSWKLGNSPPNEYRLVSIAVAAGASRKGVGTALVEGFEKTIRAECDSYRLSVLKTNSPAIGFCEKLAFQFVGETESAWSMRKELAAANPGVRPSSR